jgi:hypothetical protein
VPRHVNHRGLYRAKRADTGFSAPPPPQQPPGGYQPQGWPQQPPSQPRRKSHRARNVILGVLGAIVLIIVIAVAASGGKGNTPTASSTSQPPASAAATTAPASSAATTAPTTPAPTTSPPPQYTLSQQQAIDAAENYLSEDTGWSQAGLIAQLSSSYGNGFSVADATVAVDSLTTVDWNQQAVLAAKNYMTTEPAGRRADWCSS